MVDQDLVEMVRRLATVFARRQVRHALIGDLPLAYAADLAQTRTPTSS